MAPDTNDNIPSHPVPPKPDSRQVGFSGRLVRWETSMEVRMQESYREGLASHPDPESCGGAREGAAEASIGVHAGKVLSREINDFRGPTLLSEAEGTNRTDDSASLCGTRRGRRPLACVETPCVGTRRSPGRPAKASRAASGRPKAGSR